MMKLSYKNLALHLLGLVFCTVPVACAVISYFPIWRAAGDGSVLSGGVLVLLLICSVPIIKYFGRLMKSPSAHMMWLIIFALFFLLSKIAQQMTAISLVGFLGNLIGAVCFKLARPRAGIGDEKNGEQ